MRKILGQFNLYTDNVTIVKRYGDNKFKVTTHNKLRVAGLEPRKEKKKRTYDHKLDENLSRARSTIYELAYCNEWDYFCTFTLNKEKYDRYNLAKFRSDFTQTIRDLRKKYGVEIAYLLIPERHKDGAWHMHGFIKGLPDQELRDFTLQEKLPPYIRKKLENGFSVLEWTTYRRKFGFCDLELIQDREACSAYVTKYITKELLNSVQELNHKTYYCSQGLERAVELKRGRYMGKQPLNYSFENEYVHICWARDMDISNILAEIE